MKTITLQYKGDPDSSDKIDEGFFNFLKERGLLFEWYPDAPMFFPTDAAKAIPITEFVGSSEDAWDKHLDEHSDEIDLFASCEDYVDVENHPNGIVFNWSKKGVGFGQLGLYVKDNELIIDNEGMDTEFCLKIIEQSIREKI